MKNLMLASILCLAVLGCATTDAHGPGHSRTDWLNFGVRYFNDHGTIAIGGGQSNQYGGYYYPSYPNYGSGYNYYPQYGQLPPKPPGTYGPFHGTHQGPLPANCFVDYYYNSYTIKCSP